MSISFAEYLSELSTFLEAEKSLLLVHLYLSSFLKVSSENWYCWITECEHFKIILIVFSPLYILASFVKDKVSIGVWIYLWVFYFVPLIYISVFVPVPYCLDDCGFVVEPEVRQVDSSSSILPSQDCFGYSRFFVFPYKV